MHFLLRHGLANDSRKHGSVAIHVQYTQTESTRLRHFTTRLDSHGVVSRANRLPAWRIDNRGNDSCRFDWIESNRQHFQPTLQSTGSQNLWNKDTWTFLVLKTWPQNLVDSYHSCRIDNIFNPPYIVHASRLPACRIHSRGNDSCRFDRIESNRQHFRPTLKAQIS